MPVLPSYRNQLTDFSQIHICVINNYLPHFNFEKVKKQQKVSKHNFLLISQLNSDGCEFPWLKTSSLKFMILYILVYVYLISANVLSQ